MYGNRSNATRAKAICRGFQSPTEERPFFHPHDSGVNKVAAEAAAKPRADARVIMVERPEQRTNRAVISDFIPILFKPYKQKRQFYRDLYLKEGLSAAQIADRIGCSKTAVLQRLREQGIRIPHGRKTNPKNYRLYHPPYGFRRVGGVLVPFRSELKICRLIVQLRDRAMSFRTIGRELAIKQFKDRNGKVHWPHSKVRRIYTRWRDKV